MTPEGPPDPFAPAKLGPVTLRNRVIKAATFEGQSDGHRVRDGLVDFHRAVAAGGVGMSTVAFCAVSPDGRGAPNQLLVTEDALPGLARVVDAIHGEGAAAAVQLGHAGPVASATGVRGLGPSRMFAPVAMTFARQATEDDIRRVVGDFGRAAGLVRRAGFDSIELHFGHHYLLSAFHSPRWNRRRDRWGGSLENRARFSREVAKTVRDAAGSETAVTAKLNMDDGVRGGLGVDEAAEIARLLEADGGLDALELTGGGSFRNPMYLFRGRAPIRELAAVMPQPARLGIRIVGRQFMPTYPFEEGFFLPQARQVRAAVSLPLVLLGGITKPGTIRAAMAEGFQFVAMARALLREPDLINRFVAGAASESACVHGNECMATIYRGTHCVLVPEGERPGLSR